MLHDSTDKGTSSPEEWWAERQLQGSQSACLYMWYVYSPQHKAKDTGSDQGTKLFFLLLLTRLSSRVDIVTIDLPCRGTSKLKSSTHCFFSFVYSARLAHSTSRLLHFLRAGANLPFEWEGLMTATERQILLINEYLSSKSCCVKQCVTALFLLWFFSPPGCVGPRQQIGTWQSAHALHCYFLDLSAAIPFTAW